MTEIAPEAARRIIERVGGSGQPPEYGSHLFTVGLEPYLTVIEKEYLAGFVRQGGSAFKMVVGVYGGGKTHFLYCVRDLAWKHNFVVSYVDLRQGESPFHRLELVYRAIVRRIMPSYGDGGSLSEGTEQEPGIFSFLRTWYARKFQEFNNMGLGDAVHQEMLNYVDGIVGIESISFSRAVKAAFKALLDRREDDFIDICQWLSGEGYDRRTHGRHGILQRLDRTTAFTLLRSLVQWIRQIGFAGLVIALDEAERIPSLAARQREQHLSNLREIIDECGHSNFQRVMILYAVPDETFLEGRTQTYEALRQRVSTVFQIPNPTGVKIDLEKMFPDPVGFLREVGGKIATVYSRAYNHTFDAAKLRKTVHQVASKAHELRYGDTGYKRIFMQNLVKGLDILRDTDSTPSSDQLQMK